jgi:hypothetical protein
MMSPRGVPGTKRGNSTVRLVSYASRNDASWSARSPAPSPEFRGQRCRSIIAILTKLAFRPNQAGL